MQIGDSVVLEAGRTIRLFLGELAVEPGDAVKLDRALAEALTRPGGEDVAAEVLTLLTADPRTAEWLLDFTAHGLPPDLEEGQPVRGGGIALGGDGEPVRALRFHCPVGNDFSWYRRSVAQVIPTCRSHGVRLVPDPLRYDPGNPA